MSEFLQNSSSFLFTIKHITIPRFEQKGKREDDYTLRVLFLSLHPPSGPVEPTDLSTWMRVKILRTSRNGKVESIKSHLRQINTLDMGLAYTCNVSSDLSPACHKTSVPIEGPLHITLSTGNMLHRKEKYTWSLFDMSAICIKQIRDWQKTWAVMTMKLWKNMTPI